MFKLHALLVDALSKIRRLINRIITGKERNKKYSTKDALFDIQILANQLYCFQSIIPEDLELGKINFSENPVSNLQKEGIKQLHLSVQAFNQLLQKTNTEGFNDNSGINDNNMKTRANASHLIELDAGRNKEVNELFSTARERLTLISNLTDIYI